MFDAQSAHINDFFLTMARRHSENDREAARLAECVMQRVFEEPDLLSDAEALMTAVAQELRPTPHVVRFPSGASY